MTKTNRFTKKQGFCKKSYKPSKSRKLRSSRKSRKSRSSRKYKGGVTPEPEKIEQLHQPLEPKELRDDEKPILLPNVQDSYKRMLNITYKPSKSILEQRFEYGDDALHLPKKSNK